jgi:hypothetical protein
VRRSESGGIAILGPRAQSHRRFVRPRSPGARR